MLLGIVTRYGNVNEEKRPYTGRDEEKEGKGKKAREREREEYRPGTACSGR